MLTLPVGILFTAIVLFYSFMDSDLTIFLNFHSFVIVIAGTVAVTALITPFKALKNTWNSIIYLFKDDDNRESLLIDLFKLAEDKTANVEIKHPLAEYAQSLWQQGVDPQLSENLIYSKFEDLNSKLDEPVHIFKSLAKYPPALGMMGTAMGMVKLFAGLSGENKGNIGSDLALAMTATLYGLLLANLVISPLSDRLNNKKVRAQQTLDLVCKNIVLINNDEPVSIIKESNEAAAA